MGCCEAGGDGRRRALHADDACSFEHRALLGAESLDLLFDQLPDIVGNSGFDRAKAIRESPLSIVLHDRAFVDQILDEIHHEQRVTFGALVNEPGESLLEAMPAQLHVQIRGDVAFAEVLERDFVAQTMRLQLALRAFQRMVAENHLDGPIGPDHHEPGRIAPPREVPDQVERRVIAPVQILEREYQR